MSVRAEGLADVDRVEARAVIQIHELVISVGAGLAILCLNEVEDELLVLVHEIMKVQQDGSPVALAHASAGILDGPFHVVRGSSREAEELLASKWSVSMVLLAGAADIAGWIGIKEIPDALGETGLGESFHGDHCPKNISDRYMFFEI